MPVNARVNDDAALEEQVRQALRCVTIGPDGPDVVSAGHVYDIVATGGAVRILLDPDRVSLDEQEALADVLRPLTERLDGVHRVVVKPRPRSIAHRQQLPGIGHVVAVHSGKGGVGKSTVAVNLALAMAQRGSRIGLLDADVYGPSCPMLLGLGGRAREDDGGGRIAPMQAYGIKVMSLGFLMPEGQALIWRGSLVDAGMPSLFSDVSWGELDILFVDLPPGTSDVHLAVAREVTLAGVITVSAPGQVSVEDVRRGMEMFADLAVPCVGLIENMAGVRCRRCGDVRPVFGADGVAALAQELGVPLLASLPFEPEVASSGDAGKPIVIDDPDAPVSQVIQDIAAALATFLAIPRTEGAYP